MYRDLRAWRRWSAEEIKRAAEAAPKFSVTVRSDPIRGAHLSNPILQRMLWGGTI
jgi:hypothetical protein